VGRDTFVYKITGGCEIKADVCSAGDGARPVIFWVHGGALIMGWRGGIAESQRDCYLRAGYHVVSVDYRLAPETKLPEIAEDLRDAYLWVREEGPARFGANANRIAVIGHSAGGYLTLLAGCLLRPRPRALVSFYGYGDIVGEWYSRPDPYYCTLPPVPAEEAYAAVGHGVLSEDRAERDRGCFYLYCRQQGLWPREVVGHDPATEPEAFAPWCPVRHVDAAYPPTLLLHGDRDTDVPYQQSVMMAEALSQAGVTHELITIAGGGHGFDGEGSEATERALARVMGFLGEALA
jgi:acetyl esterase/lipase